MVPQLKETLSRQYLEATPFPHICSDDFYPAERLRVVAREIEAARIDPESPGYGWFGKRRASDIAHFPTETRKLVIEMNSPEFRAWLSEMTGIPDLQSDPELEGGGIHQIPPGGYLKVHTDFNWNKRLGMHRRVNVLLYLNEDWEESWGGNIEFWHEDDIGSAEGEPRASYLPIFNRMVAFTTTDFSYHGHPDPLKCPPDRTRNSIALYYYTKERPPEETKFGSSELTNFRERADDRSMGLRHKLHQALIRNPILRRVFGR